MSVALRIPARIRWLLIAWPDPGKRRSVASGYAAAFKERPLVLADIALRGSVYQPTQARDAVELARAEGRRELALEIIQLAGADPAALLRMIDHYEAPQDRRTPS